MKRLIIALILVVAVAGSALAQSQAKTVTGKITAIEGNRITIAIEGERPSWIRKNGGVKFKVGPGKIVELAASDASPFTITVTSKKASALAVDEVVTFEKGLVMAGC